MIRRMDGGDSRKQSVGHLVDQIGVNGDPDLGGVCGVWGIVDGLGRLGDARDNGAG